MLEELLNLSGVDKLKPQEVFVKLLATMLLILISSSTSWLYAQTPRSADKNSQLIDEVSKLQKSVDKLRKSQVALVFALLMESRERRAEHLEEKIEAIETQIDGLKAQITALDIRMSNIDNELLSSPIVNRREAEETVRKSLQEQKGALAQQVLDLDARRLKLEKELEEVRQTLETLGARITREVLEIED